MHRIVLGFLLLCWVLGSTMLRAQSGPDVLRDTTVYVGFFVPSIMVNGELVPHVNLRSVTVLPPVRFTNERQRKRYSRLEYNIRKVYPYAQQIEQIYSELNKALDTITDKKQQKAYINMREDELKAKFESKLRKLTFSQGRLLIKLVDRQTGATTYEVVKQLKGSMSAFFWQGIARIFGSNLKSEYDEKGDDWMVEDIITRLENGQI